MTHGESDRRKVYRLTDSGRAELAAHLDELADLERQITGTVREVAAELRADVRGSVQDLRAEPRQAPREMVTRALGELRALFTDATAGSAGPYRS